MADVEPPGSQVVQPLAGSAASLGLSTFEGAKGVPAPVDIAVNQGPPDTSGADVPVGVSTQSDLPAGSENAEKPPVPADLSAVPGAARIPIDASVGQRVEVDPPPDRPAADADGLNREQLDRLDKLTEKGDKEAQRDRDKRDRLRNIAGGVAQTPHVASTSTSSQPGRSVLPVQLSSNRIADSATATKTLAPFFESSRIH